MAQTVGLCPICAEKLSEAYRLTETGSPGRCSLCGAQGVITELWPKHRQKPAGVRVNTGLKMNREKYLQRRRWA